MTFQVYNVVQTVDIFKMQMLMNTYSVNMDVSAIRAIFTFTSVLQSGDDRDVRGKAALNQYALAVAALLRLDFERGPGNQFFDF